jgi:signal transduction histidine kinase
MLLATTLRFFALIAGTALHLFLGVLLARKRDASALERLLLGGICSAGIYDAASAAAFFYRINTGIETNSLLLFLDRAADVGLALGPAFLLHFCLVWGGLRKLWGLAAYLSVPLSLSLMASGRSIELRWLLGAILLLSSLTCLWNSQRPGQRLEGGFLRSFAAALAFPGLTLLAGGGPALTAWASLAPPVCLAYFIYKYDLLGLLISRRIIFALNLGVFAAFYLFLVRRVAGFVEDEFDFLGPLAEIALIFAAALVWLPLYAWMSRFLTKRAQIYADFSKRLIEEAARILDFDRRVQYLAEEVGRSFHLRRALLVTSSSPRLQGRHGPADEELTEIDLAALEHAAHETRAEFVQAHHTRHAPMREILHRTGFNYLFPLWYENHLTGLLLLDTSPKIFLDDDEEVLLGLCRQISHSIETARVVEEKIHLEKELLDQEHLARLGKAAATIAHEVKNPLSSIKTLAQLMKEDPEVANRYARDLNYMIKEVDRLNGSVQQLLSFARPPREIKTDINLADVLETAARVLGQQDNNGVRVEFLRGPAVQLNESNPDLLDQIVLNLVLNAMQASDPGGVVQVGCENHGDGRVSFFVDDNGPGVPPELHERIFEPFYTTKQKGTGLGLAIVKKNVTLLHGEIELQSPLRNSRGTRVKVAFPAN